MTQKPSILTILDCLSGFTGVATIADLKEATQIPSATLNRLLNRLVDCGYTIRERHGEYRIGPALVELSKRCLDVHIEERFRPFLRSLRDETGLNAELYSMTSQGPMMLFWEGGISEFRVRMNPGHLVKHSGHPAVQLHGILHPEATIVWDVPLVKDQSSKPEDKTIFHEYFRYESGQVRPELSRCCVLTRDKRHCVGLSGLISEFTLSPENLNKFLNDKLEKMENHSP